MKTKLIIISGLFLGIFIFSSCDSDNSTGTGNQNEDNGNYYPVGDGTYYKYNIDRTDSNGSHTTGTRSSTYNGTNTMGSTIYQVQIDSITIGGQVVGISTTYFRKTDAGVYFFLDTTGLSSSVPDSLIQYLSFDTEIRGFYFPLSDGLTWPAFKMNLNLGIINFSVVDVTGYYDGKEDIQLNLTSGTITKEAAKIRYVLKLTVPDPNNPFVTYSTSYEARAWLIENVGVAKWEGNGTVLNALAGGGIDFADTTTVVTQNLIEYQIK